MQLQAPSDRVGTSPGPNIGLRRDFLGGLPLAGLVLGILLGHPRDIIRARICLIT